MLIGSWSGPVLEATTSRLEYTSSITGRSIEVINLAYANLSSTACAVLPWFASSGSVGTIYRSIHLRRFLRRTA